MNFSHKFKHKRKYAKYYKDTKLVAEILTYFESHKHQSYKLTDLSLSSGIPVYQLSKWRTSWEKDSSFVPGKALGQHKRLFTEDQERNAADFIRVQFINTGVMMRRKHLKSILYTLWQSFDLEKRSQLPKRLISNHFVKSFCKRNGFSFRRMRKKKRSDVNEEEVRHFLQEFAEAFSTYPWFRILNMDETSWNYVFLRGEVLAEKGKEDVNAQLPDDYRKSFTTIATIGADGTKYPPFFLAKGKTYASVRQFEGMKSADDQYHLHYSEGGNTDEKTMLFYLRKVTEWMNHEPCVLILDHYPSHETDAVKELATSLGIKLIYIPTSATEKYQPLDRRIFGAVKSMGSSYFDDFVFESKRGYTKPEAADLFIKCWSQVTVDLIQKAWKLGENEDDEEEETNDSDFEPYDDCEEEEEDIGELDDGDLFVIEENRREIRRARNPLTPPRPL